MTLPVGGKEVFTPHPLVRGRLYRLTFSGNYTYTSGIWAAIFNIVSLNRRADAIYHADSSGNLRVAYHGLKVENGKSSCHCEDWQEDRATSSYTCLVRGTGQRLSFRLGHPGVRAEPGEHVGVSIGLLPVGTLTSAEREDAEKRAKAAAEEAERQRQAAAAEQSLALSRQAETGQRLRQAQAEELRKTNELKRQLELHAGELRRMVEINRNVFDPEFRRAYVEKYQQQIRESLGRAWAADYESVMGNEALIQVLNAQASQVLDWYKLRLEMALEAERLDVLPKPTPSPPPPPIVPLTPRAIDSVRESLGELYRLRDRIDQAERSMGSWSGNAIIPPRPAPPRRALEVGLQQLARYGINADSPEEAEAQFEQLRVGTLAVKTPYERIRERLAAGDEAGLDILGQRVKDLFVEQCILFGQRRTALRQKDRTSVRESDERLRVCREEFAQLIDLLKQQGFPLELAPQETTLEESLVGLVRQKLRVAEVFKQLGDAEGAEAVENLYAEQMVALFKPTAENYT